MKSIRNILLLVLISFAAMAQPSEKPVSKKAIKKWVKKKEWGNGLSLNLHATVNTEAFYTAYHKNPELWDAALGFLAAQNLQELAPGKYPIVGEDVFASVTEAPSHKPEEVKWESHRKYIDLQYIIKGKEIIGIADASKATVTKPYSPDVINYTADGNYFTTEPNTFFLFFPNDAHRPTIKAEGYDVVKKIVIKIKS
ncbi:YhcH/YjgK/YiaL family protein [Flavihumibacter fluvii]|uniref:YhcH/YjgK/YiaL family protein n=1 Tax=Flavihumibacter fluvii TaxID=2838157 RepID=UPI001BDEB229|nr:YhcH/YjgK/YiaL family protein [Flavihumibacter fluvii]ULQ54140.1 YhcH/YjgK/YiaL family protein [Flavihumibacter fluvii]